MLVSLECADCNRSV